MRKVNPTALKRFFSDSPVAVLNSAGGSQIRVTRWNKPEKMKNPEAAQRFFKAHGISPDYSAHKMEPLSLQESIKLSKLSGEKPGKAEFYRDNRNLFVAKGYGKGVLKAIKFFRVKSNGHREKMPYATVSYRAIADPQFPNAVHILFQEINQKSRLPDTLKKGETKYGAPLPLHSGRGVGEAAIDFLTKRGVETIFSKPLSSELRAAHKKAGFIPTSGGDTPVMVWRKEGKK